MSEMKSHPAVFAGLTGGAALGVPMIAFAAPLDGIAETIAGSLVLQFAVGCAAGAAVAGSVAFVAERIYVHKEADGAEEEDDQVVIDKNNWSYSSVNLVRGLSPDLDDTDRDMGAYLASKATEETSDTSYLGTTTIVVRPRHLRKPRHFAADVRIRMVAADAEMRPARHFASASQPEHLAEVIASQQEEVRRGRHYAPPLDAPEAAVEASGAQSVVGEPQQAEQPQVETVEAPVAESNVAEPQAEAAKADRPVTNYGPATAKKQGLLKRMSTRAKAMRKALAARLSSAASVDEVPVIQRADGSAMEVAPSRIEQAIAPVIESIANSLEDTADTAALESTKLYESVTASEEVTETTRATYISRHVSEVDLGVFPERRSADELERHDMWEEALDAMGESYGQNTVIFRDEVGGPSTIDDPDGLEGPTEFIEVRLPMAQTETMDTDTYVNYLLRNELSHSDNKVLRTSPHAHLRVIEGGTGTLRTRRRASETTTPTRVGRHYAPQSLAREA